MSSLGMVLASSALVDVVPPLTVGAVVVPLPLVAVSVPVPTLVDGRPL